MNERINYYYVRSLRFEEAWLYSLPIGALLRPAFWSLINRHCDRIVLQIRVLYQVP